MMSQMNVRIDDGLRTEGNLALESVGWSPSRAVREVWGFAARNRRNPRRLREMRRFFEEDEQEPLAPSKVEEGSRIVAEGLAAMGIDIAKCKPSDLSYDELREQVLYERLEERGLL